MGGGPGARNAPRRAPRLDREQLRLQRLAQHGERALVERVRAHGVGRVARDEDARHAARLAPQRRQHLEPGLSRHVHVEQRQVDRLLAQDAERLGPALRLQDLQPPRQPHEQLGDADAERAVVVGDQDAVVDRGRHGRTGGGAPKQGSCRRCPRRKDRLTG
jgi:hypothetical protein